MEISYENLVSAWDGYSEWLRALIRRVQPKQVLEVGAGAKPAIPESELADLGIAEYSVLDISQSELAKAPGRYKKICADISSESLQVTGEYDLIFSRMLAEHVRTPIAFHRNIHRLLAPGGRAFHFYATMFCPVYVLNRLMPEWLSWKLVSFADPKRTKDGDNDKFPAYYRWCYGPVRWQIRRFEQMGYEVETYKGFFGHGYYNRIPLLREAHNWLTSHLLKRPNPYLTTVAYLVLRKPEKGESADFEQEVTKQA